MRRREKHVKVARRVHFSHLVTVHTLDDEDEDRRSVWMKYAIDRQHFNRRIRFLAPALERVLTIAHRQKIRQRL